MNIFKSCAAILQDFGHPKNRCWHTQLNLCEKEELPCFLYLIQIFASSYISFYFTIDKIMVCLEGRPARACLEGRATRASIVARLECTQLLHALCLCCASSNGSEGSSALCFEFMTNTFKIRAAVAEKDAT